MVKGKWKLCFILMAAISLLAACRPNEEQIIRETDESVTGQSYYSLEQESEENTTQRVQESLAPEDCPGTVEFVTDSYIVSCQRQPLGYDVSVYEWKSGACRFSVQALMSSRGGSAYYIAEDKLAVRDVGGWYLYDYEGNLLRNIDWEQLLPEMEGEVSSRELESFSPDLSHYSFTVEVRREDTVLLQVYLYDMESDSLSMIWEYTTFPVEAHRIRFVDMKLAEGGGFLAFVGHYFADVRPNAQSTECYGVYDIEAEELLFVIDEVDTEIDVRNGKVLFRDHYGIEGGKSYVVLYDTKAGRQQRLEPLHREECFNACLSWDGSELLTYHIQDGLLTFRSYEIGSDQSRVLAEYACDSDAAAYKKVIVTPEGVGIYIEDDILKWIS